MSDPEIDPPTEHPATWENVAVAKAMEVLGKVTRDDALVKEGEEQEEIAHEVREEYDEERDS